MYFPYSQGFSMDVMAVVSEDTSLFSHPGWIQYARDPEYLSVDRTKVNRAGETSEIEVIAQTAAVPMKLSIVAILMTRYCQMPYRRR